MVYFCRDVRVRSLHTETKTFIMENTLGYFICLLGLLLAAGCEIDNTSSGGGNDSGADAFAADNQAASEQVAEASEQGGEWGNIVWYTSRGPAAPNAEQVMTLSANISADGRFVNFSWDRYPWNDAALGHFFVWNGSAWEGGKFEFIRTGGQPVKTTDNIRNGYNGLSAPAPGTPVAFAWTTQDGRQRSNLAKTTWR